MSDPRPAPVSLRAGLAGLLLLALYLALIEALLGWADLGRSLLNTGPWPVLMILAGLFASYALRALRIRKAEPRVPLSGLGDVVQVFALYNAANWLLPARLGEASLPLLLQRRFGTPLVRGTGILLWLRLLDLHVIGVLGGAVLCLEFRGPWQWLGAIAIAGGLALPALGGPATRRLARRWPRLQALASAVPAQPGAAAGDLGLAWAAWGVKLGALGAALSTISTLSYPAGVLGALGGDISGVLPLHAPLGAGSYEAGVLLALAPWQPDLKATLAAAVQLHALLLVGALTLGALALPSLRRRTMRGD